jgi:hypothetical protein
MRMNWGIAEKTAITATLAQAGWWLISRFQRAGRRILSTEASRRATSWIAYQTALWILVPLFVVTVSGLDYVGPGAFRMVLRDLALALLPVVGIVFLIRTIRRPLAQIFVPAPGSWLA